MGAPLEFCSKRSVVAVLASGVVISMTALTGGIAPAIADPKTEPVVPTTTTVTAPEPESIIPEETKQAEAEAPKPEAPPSAPVTTPAPPSVESPPETQAPEPAPQTVAPTTAPVITPVVPASPTTAVDPPETTAEAPAPRVVAPPNTEQAPATSAEKSPATVAPATPPAPLTTSATASESPTASASSVPPSPALVAPTSETTSGSAAPETEGETSTAGVDTSESSTVSQAAQLIEPSEPQTLEAPEQDVQIAKSAKVVEVKPDPAPKQDVDALSSELNVDLGLGGRDSVNASADAEVRLASARVWDRDIRQWSPDWVEYDEFYRPVILNPFRDAVRIVYVYQNAPRIVWIPPLARIVLEVAQFAAYSFTAVVATAANLGQRGSQHGGQRRGGQFLRRRILPGHRPAAPAAPATGVALRQRPRAGALLGQGLRTVPGPAHRRRR